MHDGNMHRTSLNLKRNRHVFLQNSHTYMLHYTSQDLTSMFNDTKNGISQRIKLTEYACFNPYFNVKM